MRGARIRSGDIHAVIDNKGVEGKRRDTSDISWHKKEDRENRLYFHDECQTVSPFSCTVFNDLFCELSVSKIDIFRLFLHLATHRYFKRILQTLAPKQCCPFEDVVLLRHARIFQRRVPSCCSSAQATASANMLGYKHFSVSPTRAMLRLIHSIPPSRSCLRHGNKATMCRIFSATLKRTS